MDSPAIFPLGIEIVVGDQLNPETCYRYNELTLIFLNNVREEKFPRYTRLDTFGPLDGDVADELKQ